MKSTLVQRFSVRALVTTILMLVSSALFAQAFPNKPVRLVVTYPPGGSSDLMARIMGQKLSALWGQSVVSESKPGAAGAIGMEFRDSQPTVTPSWSAT